jgi:hypothetical protein
VPWHGSGRVGSELEPLYGPRVLKRRHWDAWHDDRDSSGPVRGPPSIDWRQDCVSAGRRALGGARRLSLRSRRHTWRNGGRWDAARGAFARVRAGLSSIWNCHLEAVVACGGAASSHEVSNETSAEGRNRLAGLQVACESQGCRWPGRQSDDAHLVDQSDENETDERLWARLDPDEKLTQHSYPRGAHPYRVAKIRGRSYL